MRVYEGCASEDNLPARMRRAAGTFAVSSCNYKRAIARRSRARMAIAFVYCFASAEDAVSAIAAINIVASDSNVIKLLPYEIRRLQPGLLAVVCQIKEEFVDIIRGALHGAWVYSWMRLTQLPIHHRPFLSSASSPRRRRCGNLVWNRAIRAICAGVLGNGLPFSTEELFGIKIILGGGIILDAAKGGLIIGKSNRCRACSAGFGTSTIPSIKRLAPSRGNRRSARRDAPPHSRERARARRCRPARLHARAATRAASAARVAAPALARSRRRRGPRPNGACSPRLRTSPRRTPSRPPRARWAKRSSSAPSTTLAGCARILATPFGAGARTLRRAAAGIGTRGRRRGTLRVECTSYVAVV